MKRGQITDVPRLSTPQQFLLWFGQFLLLGYWVLASLVVEERTLRFAKSSLSDLALVDPFDVHDGPERLKEVC